MWHLYKSSPSVFSVNANNPWWTWCVTNCMIRNKWNSATDDKEPGSRKLWLQTTNKIESKYLIALEHHQRLSESIKSQTFLLYHQFQVLPLRVWLDPHLLDLLSLPLQDKWFHEIKQTRLRSLLHHHGDFTRFISDFEKFEFLIDKVIAQGHIIIRHLHFTITQAS